MGTMNNLTDSSIWKKLEKQYFLKWDYSIKDFFKEDEKRFENYSILFEDILFDFSKNHIDEEILPLLILLAEKSKLKHSITRQFVGGKINSTENRAVLHTALRNTSEKKIELDSVNIIPDIQEVNKQIKDFAECFHSGEYKSSSEKKFDTIVNIGIGGSHLGPDLVCSSLQNYAMKGLSVHFLSNIDKDNLNGILKKINIETTLFIIASKTFTTQETMVNATSVKKYLQSNLHNVQDYSKHFVAISTNIPACRNFGIPKERVFKFWDWVGGRFSLWSAIGMPIVLYIGYNNFVKLLNGANQLDEHFRTAPFMENIPVIMALLDIWYINFFKTKARAIIPYSKNLEKLPSFLQQLEMESNGKRIDIEGDLVNYDTGQIIWGSAGTDSQHSFFQLLHQGTQIIPIDFLAPCQTNNDNCEHQDILISNMIAQGKAFMKGKTETEALMELEKFNKDEEEMLKILPHKIFQGNRPLTTILFKKLDPKTLGILLALYEQKVFVQGIIWNINSFDQWGVELGKQLAKNILQDIIFDEETKIHDSSTNGLINFYKKMKH